MCIGVIVRVGVGFIVKFGVIFRVIIVIRDIFFIEVFFGIVLIDIFFCKIEMKEIFYILKILIYMYVVEKLFFCKIEMKEIFDILKI